MANAVKLTKGDVSTISKSLEIYSASLRRAAKKDGQLQFAVDGYNKEADSVDLLRLQILDKEISVS